MRSGAFQGDDDEGQTICNYCNTRLDVRVRASWHHFFPGAYTVSSCDINTLLARSSGKWPRDSLGHMLGFRTRSQRHGQLKSCARAPSLG